MQHLKTENEHQKNEAESQHEVIKVLQERYYNTLFKRD